jgi:uncharacterized protein (TIGR00290 family)
VNADTASLRTKTEAELTSIRERVLVSWSGGKDSCMALEQILTEDRFQVAALVTTLTRESDCISMHGVRRVLLERQAQSLGFPLEQVVIPRSASNQEYEAALEHSLAAYREAGVESIVFGDLFLEDIRSYREALFDRLGMRPLFPLWKRDTSALIRDFITRGFKTVITCVNSRSLDSSFAGRVIDSDFLSRLPPDVDPCGENGEFHTFVFDGPLFKQDIPFKAGNVRLEENHYFCDLIPS